MIRNIFLLFIAVLPVYLIGLYIYKKDKDKESKKLLFKLFIFGVLSCIPAVILELTIGSFFNINDDTNLFILFLYIFISIAFVEEICKWFLVYKMTYTHQEFDHIYDAIVYCVFLSLGFAGFENILYIFEGGFTIALLRGVSSVPGHACFAVAMGNYLGLAKFAYFKGNKIKEKKNLILSITIPILLHGIYDYCLFTNNIFFFLLFLVILIFIYIYSVNIVKKMAGVPNNFVTSIIKSDILNICPKCGKSLTNNICSHCGNDLSHDKS